MKRKQILFSVLLLFSVVAIADNVAPLFASIPGAAPYAKDLAMITTVAIITYLSIIIC